MAYTINKTDGTILTTVADGQVDTLSSDLTLIGKNYSGFGESLNENLVKLLEHFASNSEPPHPIRGQIWFDVTELKLKVYNGTAFVPVSSATISSTQPLTLGVGDLWFNDVDKQLYFYDGTTVILLGPAYSQSQGLSGLKVVNVLDSLNQNRVITLLYTNGVLLGIFSKDDFTPKLPIEGFEGSIIPGFNQGILDGFKFNVTATNSESLGGQPASSYVRNDTSNIINGQIIISSNLGLIIGDANQGQFQVQDGNLIIANIASNKSLTLNVRRDVIAEPALVINSDSRIINMYEGYIDSQLVLGGSLTVEGDLTVNGDLVTVNTSTVTVEDKNIELASTEIPTDEYANGGGIILKGASDHEFLWIYNTATGTRDLPGGDGNYNLAWNSTEHINLQTGKSYYIDGVEVLSKTSLGPSITSIPGVTSFGAQTQLTVDWMYFNDATIEVTEPATDLVISIDSGTLNLSANRISNVADPTSAQDAATKEYVDNKVEGRPIVLSMDISDGISNSAIAAYIEQIAPAASYRNGTYAKILCSFAVNSTTTLEINPLINTSTTEFNTPTGTAFGISNIAISNATVDAPGIAISRTVKTFQIQSGAWTFIP